MSDPASRLNAALEGRYRIHRELGEGGMATVYLAEDVRHDRQVALKVLKPELAAVVGAERFLAEIRTTAGLQHPHILPLHDSGEADGFLFYVMPYVDGESLRHRLDREKQLPVEEALSIVTAVAHALQAAHDKGVIHRDIKPANILLSGGEPLVADFGIALAFGAAGGARLTETGLSVGTPHYMSPEQATGDRNVGPAADTYALACVLYEMLVGEPPYTGNSAQVVLGKILTGEFVSPVKTRPTVPLNVDAAIRRALERLPADRFKKVQDFARALVETGFRYGEATGVGGHGGARTWKAIGLGMTALAIVATVVAIFAVRRSVSGPLARFDITPGEVGRLASDPGEVSMAISGDGSRIVYVGAGPSGRQLWRRELDALEAQPIPGTDGATAPALSPDGRSVAFAADGGVKTVSLEGGSPFTVAARGSVPAWSSNETLVFERDRLLHRVPATGGEAVAVTSPSDGGQWLPWALPDGRGLLLTIYTGSPRESRVAVVGPEGGEVRTILSGTIARYAESGHLVYGTADGTLMAAPFDLRSLDVTGPSVGVLEGVEVSSVTGASQFALSTTGTLVYRTGASVSSQLVWTDRAGVVTPIATDWAGEIQNPSLSPDGARLAVAVQQAESRNIWVRDLDGRSTLRLTFEGESNDRPTWTPDGESVTFMSDRAGDWDLWTRRADGTGEASLELDQERGLVEALWSPDGQWLIYRTNFTAPGAADILALRPEVDSLPVPLASTELTESEPALSPDGRWLAYRVQTPSGGEVYVVPFPNANEGRWLVSQGGGSQPVWSRSGRELFYVNDESGLVAVEVETAPTFSTIRSTVLFSTAGFRQLLGHQNYDVAPDDERFLMIRELGSDSGVQLVLVQNFFEELHRLVPD